MILHNGTKLDEYSEDEDMEVVLSSSNTCDRVNALRPARNGHTQYNFGG